MNAIVQNVESSNAQRGYGVVNVIVSPVFAMIVFILCMRSIVMNALEKNAKCCDHWVCGGKSCKPRFSEIGPLQS